MKGTVKIILLEPVCIPEAQHDGMGRVDVGGETAEMLVKAGLAEYPAKEATAAPAANKPPAAIAQKPATDKADIKPADTPEGGDK